jgi:hypothetical protein
MIRSVIPDISLLLFYSSRAYRIKRLTSLGTADHGSRIRDESKNDQAGIFASGPVLTGVLSLAKAIHLNDWQT